MAKKDECVKCPKAKKGFNEEELRCSYFGRKPEFDGVSCSYMSKQSFNENTNSQSSQINTNHGNNVGNPNNNFAQESLLTDENIIATAMFHPLKNFVFALPLFILMIGFWVLDYERVLGTDLFWTSVDFAWTNNSELHWNGETGVVTEKGKTIGYANSIFEFSDMGIKKGYPVDKWSGNLLCEHIWQYRVKTTATIIYIIICLILTVVAYYIMKWINSKDEFVITNKRVIVKVGVIRRVAFELHNEQMESIEISQGVIGRILNYGTLMPCGIGASKVRIPFVVNPFEFRQHFYELKKPKNVD